MGQQIRCEWVVRDRIELSTFQHPPGAEARSFIESGRAPIFQASYGGN